MFLFTLEMLSIGYACSKSSLNFTWYQTKLERIHCVFGYGDGDKNVRALGSALCDLLHHNTDLEGEHIHSSLNYLLTLYHSQSSYLLAVSSRQTFSISYVLPSLKLTMKIHPSHRVLDYSNEEIILCSVSIDYYLPLFCYRCLWCSKWNITV